MADKQESIGAIWKRKTKNGKEYLYISLNDEIYTAWKNDYKKENKHPDYKIYPQQPRPQSTEEPF